MQNEPEPQFIGKIFPGVATRDFDGVLSSLMAARFDIGSAEQRCISSWWRPRPKPDAMFQLLME